MEAIAPIMPTLCLMSILSAILSLTLSAASAATPVFRGAQGFGIETRAGQGGRVLIVNSLASTGPGTLRAALETKGPRIVVFEIAGVIDLARNDLAIAEPFLTVAGQTAPSPGITIIRGGILIKTHDVLLQHIRVRPGDAGQPKKSGWEPEVSTTGAACYNIVVDHCSISWSVDENLSASGPRLEGPQATTHNVTFSHNILAEGLYDSSHSKGVHSMGSLIHDHCTNIAVIGNLYAHNNDRNPYFKAHTTGVIVNNLIYNPGRAAIRLNWVPEEWKGAKIQPANARVSIAGNVMYAGANTSAKLALVASKGDAYLEDNLAFDRAGQPAAITAGDIRVLSEKPSWPAGLKAMPASQTAAWVLRHAGARPKDRDEVDRRIVRDVEQRQGRFIDSQEEVGGYPQVAPVTRKLTIPKDVDAWLRKLAADLE
jgi:hypothetical protein